MAPDCAALPDGRARISSRYVSQGAGVFSRRTRAGSGCTGASSACVKAFHCSDVSIHSRPVRRLTPQPTDRGRADCPSLKGGVTEKDFICSAVLSTSLFLLKGEVSNHKGIFDESWKCVFSARTPSACRTARSKMKAVRDLPSSLAALSMSAFCAAVMRTWMTSVAWLISPLSLVMGHQQDCQRFSNIKLICSSFHGQSPSHPAEISMNLR